MARYLTLHENGQLASHYEMWLSMVQVQRWWRSFPGPCASLDVKTIENCHCKLISTGFVIDTHRSCCPSKSILEENIRKVEFQVQSLNQRSRARCICGSDQCHKHKTCSLDQIQKFKTHVRFRPESQA